MNLNDRRLQAYQNLSKSDDERAKDSSIPAAKETIAKVTHESATAAVKALTQGGLLKVPVAPREADGKESVYRRVAKFLLLIGENEAAKIMPHLTEEQIEKIVPELASIRRVEPEEAESILAEFQSLVQKSREDGGVETARSMLEKAFGAEKAGALIEKSVPFADGKPFEYLAEADAEKVGLLLKDESGAVRALVLSYLQPKVSAAVITALPDEEKKDVVMRLAKLKQISPEVVKRVDSAMREKLNSLVVEKSDSIDGRNALAQILKQMSPENEDSILSRLSSQDPDLGADLRERLFTSEDILNADDRYLQNLLRTMSDTDLAYLIAGKDDDFRRKILHNVSQNRAGIILDEEQAKKPMLRSDCEKITSQFFSTLRRAWEDGELIIKGRDDEIYV
ncbi:MAG: flagellar motor switch protein FliG [Treponema sp.]|nr:flagellar motor switch protein FliG [Treponema sp.]